MKSLESL